MKTYSYLLLMVVFSIGISSNTQVSKENVLPDDEVLNLWNTSETKSSILSFVDDVTIETSDKFLPVEERVVVFDMDGTILLEKPNYVLFAENHFNVQENR